MIPEDTIDYNIRKTWYSISKMYNKTANEYMASMSLGMLILNIDIYDGTPSTQIGPLMGMESTSLSRSLSNLEERGIITRERDSLDKRKSIIKRKVFLDSSNSPLGKGYWDFALDVAGGKTLSKILKGMNYGGIITCCGLVDNPKFEFLSAELEILSSLLPEVVTSISSIDFDIPVTR